MLIIVFSFCNENNNKSRKKIEIPLKKNKNGVVIKTVVCKLNSKHSYSLYLPSYYNPEINYPIIIAFDPQAKGSKPVKLFSKIAEKYGYIVIGSNNIKNKLKDVNTAINILFEEIFDKYSIDSKRVYTAGFSGGARIASLIAVYKGGIRGIISCSAGLSTISKEISNRFEFVGMVGNKDFNYLEMKKLYNELEKTNFTHTLLIFDGEHNWPSERELEIAILWFEVNTIKNKIIPVDDAVLRNYSDLMAKEINQLNSENKITETYFLYNKFIKSLKNIYDIRLIENSFLEFKKTSKVKKALNEIKKLEKKEDRYQSKYIEAFAKSNFTFLNLEINRLKKMINIDDASRQEKLMNKRLLNIISMISFMYCNDMINKNDKKSIDYLKIYEKSDPNNKDVYYLKACYYAINMQKDLAIININQSIKYGFENFDKIKNDKRLELIKDHNFANIKK